MRRAVDINRGASRFAIGNRGASRFAIGNRGASRFAIGNRGASRFALIGVLLFCLGCRGRAATAVDCGLILDRIVELELHELGFRDPVLALRKAAEVRRVLAPDLARCEGVRVREEALACVRAATNVEDISHRCLR